MAQRVNYDEIAATFDARYQAGGYQQLVVAMRQMMSEKKPRSTLEVGCGTGFWLSALRDLAGRVYGMDYSFEMLRKAAARGSAGQLVRASADAVPFRRASFDLIFCLNAIHHFERIDYFLAQATDLLRPGGTLAVIGMDPHHGRDYWCVYDYFPETRAIDLARFPSSGRLTDAMLLAGFDRVECSVACRFIESRVGATVLDDPELQRNGCSQMALLTDEQYAAGVERIRAAIRRAEGGAAPVFGVDIAFMMVCGMLDRQAEPLESPVR